MTQVIPFPGNPTDRFQGEIYLRAELGRRGFQSAGSNLADHLGRGGNLCSLSANVRFAGMDIESFRWLRSPNNRLGLPPDPYPIWAAFDAKGQQQAQGPEFGISYSSYDGAIAFMNWRRCHTVFALIPYGEIGVWIATIPHVEAAPRGNQDGDFIISIHDCPTLDEWIADYRPYNVGRWGCPPPLAA